MVLVWGTSSSGKPNLFLIFLEMYSIPVRKLRKIKNNKTFQKFTNDFISSMC